MKIKYILVLLISFLVLSCSKETEVTDPSTQDDNFKAEVGSIAPNFNRKDIEGNDINLNDFRGKVVLLEIWATWCGPCRKKMPEMIELYNDYKDKDFEFIGISTDYSVAPLKAYVAQEGIEWSQILDEDLKISYTLYDYPGTPHTIIINKEGLIVYKGYPTDEYLRYWIDKSL
jgi:thiol-disulfide isomerase/thioredoxin